MAIKLSCWLLFWNVMIELTLFLTFSPAVNTDPNSIRCNKINKKLQTDTIWPTKSIKKTFSSYKILSSCIKHEAAIINFITLDNATQRALIKTKFCRYIIYEQKLTESNEPESHVVYQVIKLHSNTNKSRSQRCQNLKEHREIFLIINQFSYSSLIAGLSNLKVLDIESIKSKSIILSWQYDIKRHLKCHFKC